MLRDWILGRGEFLRLLDIRGPTLDQRVFKGEFSLAFGCPTTAVYNEYLPLDAFAVLLSSMLSRELGGKAAGVAAAGAVVREYWKLWLELVQLAECDPSFYANPLPGDEQQFLAIGLKRGAPPKIEGGLMAKCIKHLGDCEQVRGIPIQLVLRVLRTNARIHKVALPESLTVSPDAPAHAEWRREIAAYQKAANLRFKDRAKMKKAKAQGKELA